MRRSRDREGEGGRGVGKGIFRAEHAASKLPNYVVLVGGVMRDDERHRMERIRRNECLLTLRRTRVPLLLLSAPVSP